MSKPVIIRIHGTFAGGESLGVDWWQSGSPFEKEMGNKLPDATLEKEDEIFHWSGENSETHRREAGKHLLLNKLLHYEESNRSYIILAHSHGGNVVMHAFQEAERRGVQLRGLICWLTCGTPFLHLSNSALRISTQRVLYTVLIVAVYGLVMGLLFAAIGIIANIFFHIAAHLAGRQWLDSSSGFIFLNYSTLASFALGLLVSAGSMLWDFYRRSRRKAPSIGAYFGKWLGIWSIYDEAMILIMGAHQEGRKITTSFGNYKKSETLLPDDRRAMKKKSKEHPWKESEDHERLRWFVKIPVLLIQIIFQIIFQILFFPYKITKKVYFRILANYQLPNMLLNHVSGNDINNEWLKNVSFSPSGRRDLKMPLSEKTEQLLLEQANKGLLAATEAARRSYTLVAFSNTDAKISEANKVHSQNDGSPIKQAFNGLVHCGYFKCDAVLEKITKLIEPKIDSSIEKKE